LDDTFVIFWGHELQFEKVLLIDPKQKKHDVRIHRTDNRDLVICSGVLEISQYYGLLSNKIIHLNYVDENTFLFKLFYCHGVEMDYTPPLVSSSNPGYDPADFYHSMAKCLSAHDIKSSSLVLHHSISCSVMV